MGEISGSNPRKYYRFNRKLHKLERSEGKGVYVPVRGISGSLDGIKRVLNKPRGDQKWRAHWSYEFVFTDVDNETGEITEFVINCVEGQRATNSLINRLANVTAPGIITVIAFKAEESDNTIVFVKNDEEKVPLKYWKWDKANEKLEGVPKPKRTKTGTDAEGNPEYAYDHTEPNQHWYEEVKKLCPIFTGKQWSDANIKGQKQAQSKSNEESITGSDATSKITDWIDSKETIKDVLSAWKKACTDPKFIPALDEDDKKLVMASAQIKATQKGATDKEYTLKLDGTCDIKDIVTDDDLPF